MSGQQQQQQQQQQGQQQVPLNDPATGWPNYDGVIQEQKRQKFEQELAGGADGGSADNPGGPCQEAFKNLGRQLYGL